MKTVRFLLAVLAVGVAIGPCGCAGAPTSSSTSPWGVLGSEGTYYLKGGGSITVETKGEETLRVSVREGRLYLNDDDLGPCAPDQPIRFLADGRLLVGGETRARHPGR